MMRSAASRALGVFWALALGGLAASSAQTAVHSSKNTVLDPEGVIAAHLAELEAAKTTAPAATCVMSADDACPLAELPAEAPSRIMPGGATTCIFGDPYAFDVYPGAPDRVVVYFEGGGACWDKASTVVDPLCTTSISDALSSEGIFDRANAKSPFANDTIIKINYCSGDCHVGDVVREYGGLKNETVTQRGALNVHAVLDWLAAQQPSKNVASPLARLVVSGSSAGSIAAQVLASNVTARLDASRMYVVLDSYVGVFPDGVEGPLIAQFGACPYVPTAALRAQCEADELRLQDVAATQIRDLLPTARVATLLSKRDAIQISYYDALSVTEPTDSLVDSLFLEPPEFYASAQRILETSYAVAADRSAGDAVAFVVDTDLHTYLNDAYLYDATTDGVAPSFDYFGGEDYDAEGRAVRRAAEKKKQGLVQWLAAFLGDDECCEACEGALIAIPSNDQNTTYCDAALASRCAATP